MRKVKVEAVWPDPLLIPDVESFKHGEYIHTSSVPDEHRNAVELFLNDSHDLTQEEREDIKYNCGTKCCVAGWAALAFGEKGYMPSDIENMATALFLNKFIEFAGGMPFKLRGSLSTHEFMSDVTREASRRFEGMLGMFEKLSAEEAHAIWIKTAEHFDYDTKNLTE